MLLFINCIITNKRSYHEDRGLWKTENTLDIFKYMLSSLAAITWSKVVIFCELDDPYKDRRKELDDYIVSLFPNASNYPYRNGKQADWQRDLEKEVFSNGDPLVWWLGNHDHIFIDYEFDLLDRITARMNELYKNGEKYVSCYFSHYPEMMLNYCCAGFEAWANSGPLLENCADYFSFRWRNNDSIQIVTKDLIRSWFWGIDYGDKFIGRSDGVDSKPESICIIPLRETVRHYDGYCRWGWSDLTEVSPLRIPAGFWDNNVKIWYCGDGPKKDYVFVNPLIEQLSCCNPNGVDYKWVLEDLPMFWKNKISSIEIAKYHDGEILKEARDRAVWRVANSRKLTIPKSVLAAIQKGSNYHIPPKEKLKIAFRSKLWRN